MKKWKRPNSGGHVLMVVSWPESRGAHPLSKSCVGPGLVLWSTGEVLNFYLTQTNWLSKHPAVTGNYSYHDQRIQFSFLLFRSTIIEMNG